jgi:hypothetical protein
MPATGKPAAGDEDGKSVQAEAQSDTEPFQPGRDSGLKKASEDLKAKIDEAKRRNSMPLDSALGNPEWERNAADGKLDIPDEDE